MIPDQLSIDLHDEDPPVDLPKTTSAASAVSDSRSQRRDDLQGGAPVAAHSSRLDAA